MHEGNLDFPHAKQNGPDGICVEVLLDRKDLIERITYNAPLTGPHAHWKGPLALACHLVIGMSLSQASELSWEDIYHEVQNLEDEEAFYLVDALEVGDVPFVFLPGLLFQKMKEELYGPKTTVLRSERKENEKLLCRCFGVTDLDIKNYLSSHPDATFEQASLDLSFSSACGSCTEDFQELLPSEIADENQFIPQGERPVVSNLFPAELILKIQECFDESLEEVLFIEELYNKSLTLSCESEIDKTKVQNLLNEKLGIEFEIAVGG